VQGRRYTAVRNRKRDEAEGVTFGGLALAEQVQLTGLFVFEQRDDHINVRLPPSARFIVQPVSTSWPGSDSQSSTPRTRDPEEISFHDLVFPLSPLGDYECLRLVHPVNIDPVTADSVHASLLVFPELARLAKDLTSLLGSLK
jgi:hypothetical protein